MSSPTPILDYAKPAKITGTWPVVTCVAGLGGLFILQTIFLPCLCDRGTVKMEIALAVDAILLLRFVIAWIRKETDAGWMYYLLFGLSSLIWIPLIVGE